MRYYWLYWLFLLFSILLYFLGTKDVMEDVVKSCDTKNEFIVDGVTYVCISSKEYFK